MNHDTPSPIVSTIVVEHNGSSGVCATVDGRRRHFDSTEDLFRAAVLLADRRKSCPPPRIPGAQQKGA